MTKRNGTKRAAKTPAANATRPHHFEETPTEVNGVVVTMLVCGDCGIRLDEAEPGDECPGAQLGEAAAEIGATPAAPPTAGEPQAAADGHENEPLLPAPAAQSLPFPVPPFDSEKAIERIFSKRHAVNASRLTMERKQAQAKEAKGEWEALAKDLEDLIEQFEDDKRSAERAVEPRLVPAKDRPDTYAHVAGEPGAAVQLCTRCGMVLVNALDAGGTPYVVGSEIGDDCFSDEGAIRPEDSIGETLAEA